MNIYQKQIDEVIKKYNSNAETGLSNEQVAEQLRIYGPNILPTEPPESLFWIFLRQFRSPLIYILLIAATIIFFVGETLDAFIISGILFFNAIIGTIQEGRMGAILESLKQYVRSTSIVIREGKKHIIPDEQLVVGDIIILQEGEKVPADARLITANNLQLDESMLTGEAAGVIKDTAIISDIVPVYDQKNMVFHGTYVLSGNAHAIVVATGVGTEVGKLDRAIETIHTELPLKRELDRLSQWILWFILFLCIVLLIMGIILGKQPYQLLVILTALFICVIPEGLPVVFTLALVSGAKEMLKKDVLVKRLQAVEGLGLTDVILIDKTGTLTRNEMMVNKIWCDGRLFSISGLGYHEKGAIFVNEKRINPKEYPVLLSMGIASTLLNKSEIEYDKKLKLFMVKGDPTDAALFIFAQKVGIQSDITNQYQLLHSLPFDVQLRLKAGLYQKDNEVIAFVIGSPETIIERSTQVPEKAQEILEDLLQQGLRVVALAEKKVQRTEQVVSLSDQEFKQMISGDLQFLGFAAIQDSIRAEVPKIVHKTRKSGLHIVMATGDHKDTALFIARKVGIYENGDEVIEGTELSAMTEDELLEQLPKITVFSRVTPEQKLYIVQLYHKLDQIVAMTGDGVNDAPSLVAADIGIAMGNIGTEVAKQASDMILLNDSFQSIIAAIEEGRHVFYTLRRVVLYFFSTNSAEILIILFALSLNLPLPLGAAQILWLNLVTDGFLDAAIATEQHDPDVLMQKMNHHLINKPILYKAIYMALPMSIGSLAIFIYYSYNLPLARTMTLITMAMFQWFNAWNCRSEKRSIFKLGLFSNRWLIAATTFVLMLQFLLIYNPFMQKIFKTIPLTLNQWLLIVTVSSSIVFIEEVRKYIAHKRVSFI